MKPARHEVINHHKAYGTTATDVWFQADKMNTITDDWLDVPNDIAAMPAAPYPDPA